jgi:hypothetical protein
MAPTTQGQAVDRAPAARLPCSSRGRPATLSSIVTSKALRLGRHFRVVARAPRHRRDRLSRRRRPARPIAASACANIGSLNLRQHSAMITNHKVCCFHNAGLIGKRCEMAMQILPAASLRSIPRLPAARVLVRVSNHLMWMALWSIGRVILRVEANVLPALREGRAAGQRPVSRASGRKMPFRRKRRKADDITEMRSTGTGEACYPTRTGPAGWRAAGEGGRSWDPISCAALA